MGRKPAIFTGNCTKADNLIEEVKVYFRVNPSGDFISFDKGEC